MEELLKNHNEYLADIKIKRRQIIKLENEELNVNTSNLSGMPSAKGYKETYMPIERNIDQIEKLKKEIKELEAIIEMINSIVNTLNSSDRSIIELRYYEGLKLESIAVTMNRDITTIQKSIQRNLENMDKILNKNENSIKVL